MLIAFSSSSPLASVAFFDESGACVQSLKEHAPGDSCNAILRLLEQGFRALNLTLEEGIKRATGFLADLGPGSFTGVKVAVTLAKSFGYALGCKVSGVPSFCLVSKTSSISSVAIPVRKGFYVFSLASGEIFSGTFSDFISQQEKSDQDISVIGYGSDFIVPSYPHAEQFKSLLLSLTWLNPEELQSNYVLDPSISSSKKKSFFETSSEHFSS